MSSDEDKWDLLDSLDSLDLVPKHNDNRLCVSCNSINIICDYSKGVMRCDDCGSCFGKVYDNRAEWSAYEDSNTDGMARCSHATSFYFPKSSMRTGISGSKNSMMRKMQQWDLMPYDEYSLYLSLKEIEEICLRNCLPQSVVDNGKIIFKKIHDKHIIMRGKKKRNGMYGACTFYGCQLQSYYRTPLEIATMYTIMPTDVTDACSRLRKILIDDQLLNSLPPVSPVNFISRYCYKLLLSKEEIDKILIITKNNIKLFLTSNHQPMSVGAACVLIYLHIYEKVTPTKQEVLDVFDITMVTTDKIFNKMLPFCNVLINDKITDMIVNKLTASKFIAVDSSLHHNLHKRSNEIRDKEYEKHKNILKSTNI